MSTPVPYRLVDGRKIEVKRSVVATVTHDDLNTSVEIIGRKAVDDFFIRQVSALLSEAAEFIAPQLAAIGLNHTDVVMRITPNPEGYREPLPSTKSA